jgi:hypothetical protein
VDQRRAGRGWHTAAQTMGSALVYTPKTQQPWQAIPILMVLLVNIFYFKKRWKALG